MSNTISIEVARGPLADLVRRLRDARGRGRVQLTEAGEVVAVVITAGELAELEELERLEDEADAEAFRQAKAVDDGDYIPLEAVEARLGL